MLRVLLLLLLALVFLLVLLYGRLCQQSIILVHPTVAAATAAVVSFVRFFFFYDFFLAIDNRNVTLLGLLSLPLRICAGVYMRLLDWVCGIAAVNSSIWFTISIVCRLNSILQVGRDIRIRGWEGG